MALTYIGNETVQVKIYQDENGNEVLIPLITEKQKAVFAKAKVI